MVTAGDVRKARRRRAVRQLPMDCPYCLETLQDAPRGWVCSCCRSTIGVEDTLAV